jgi:large subunit ribosomal protein L17
MVFGRQLSRGRKSREALFRSLSQQMVVGGKVTTTKAKAKAVQGDLERLVTLAKQGTLAAQRKVSAILGNRRKLNEILFKNIGIVFAKKNGGYTRIISLPSRKGDNAPMATIEWSEKIIYEEPKKEVKAKKETKAKKEVKKEIKKEDKKK